MSPRSLDALIEQVEAFEIDDAEPALSFAARLARENGWQLAFAERVVREYKRFVVLAMVAGHPVTPSEEVDQAWHLHLTYTRSYWDRLCGEILARPLHHNPTAGGPSEQAKFYLWYAETLASYQRIFGEPPPTEIWPPTKERFATAGAGRWIDSTRFWLVPKLRLSHLWGWWKRYRAPLVWSGLLLVPLVIAGCQVPQEASLNPLDFSGGPFLLLYIVLLFVALGVSLLARNFWPPEDAEDARISDQIADDPYLVAALAQGPRRVVYTAIASLISRGHLRVVETTETKLLGLWQSRGQQLASGDPLPPTAPEIEQLLFKAVRSRGDANPVDIVEAGSLISKSYSDSLRGLGVIDEDPNAVWGYRGFTLVVMGSLLLLGIVKLGLGLARDKPVGWLFLLLLVTAALTFVLIQYVRKRTPSGRRLLQRLRREHAELNDGVASSTHLAPESIVLGTALFGLAHWQNQSGELATLMQTMPPDRAWLDGHWLHISSSGGGGCGGAGGCGGGGGSGCGGCGGCGD